MDTEIFLVEANSHASRFYRAITSVFTVAADTVIDIGSYSV